MKDDLRPPVIDDTAPDDDPMIEELINELNRSIGDTSNYNTRLQRGYDTRFCRWDGQDEDGRKHAEVIGAPAFPFEGASDARHRRTEGVILELWNVLKAAFGRGNFQAVPVDNNTDPEAAGKIAPLLKYVFKNRMAGEIRNEVNYLTNWMLTWGSCILSIDWNRQIRMEERPITLEEIAMASIEQSIQQAEQLGADQEDTLALVAESLEETIERFMDPEYEAAAIEGLMAFAPELNKKTARVVLRELQEFGESSYPSPFVHRSQPRWVALRPMIDVFFPDDMEDVPTSRWIARAEMLSLPELRAKAIEDGWDPDFIEAMEDKTAGDIFNGTNENLSGNNTPAYSTSTTHRRTHSFAFEEQQDQYQVMHVYYRGKDEKGFPVVFKTILHPSLNDTWAKHEILEYDHGDMPFIEFRREWFNRPLLESRGVSEIVEQDQAALKTHRDALVDLESLTISPPLLTPRNRAGRSFVFGPGAQWPGRQGEFEWLHPPKHDNLAMVASEQIENDIADYWALNRENVSPEKLVMYMQNLADDFLVSMGQAAQMTVALMQQYMDPQMVSRIVGQPPEEITKEDIRGRFDVWFEFDVRDLNLEFHKIAMEFFQQVIGMDTEGVVNRAALIDSAFRRFSPGLADRVVKDPQKAAMDEVEDEKKAVAMMASGVEPSMVPEGQNYQLRKQILQQTIQGSPELMQKFQQGNGDGNPFREMVEARDQFFDFNLQQQENATIGRTGANPATPQPR